MHDSLHLAFLPSSFSPFLPSLPHSFLHFSYLSAFPSSFLFFFLHFFLFFSTFLPAFLYFDFPSFPHSWSSFPFFFHLLAFFLPSSVPSVLYLFVPSPFSTVLFFLPFFRAYFLLSFLTTFLLSLLPSSSPLYQVPGSFIFMSENYHHKIRVIWRY